MQIGFRRCLLLGLALIAQAAMAATPVEQLRTRARAGDAQAQYDLARYYGGATGETVDRQQAFDYTRQAAEHGHGPAQAELAFIYFNGNDKVGKDLPQAFRWFTKAAGNGSVVAQCMLGDFYRHGLGGVKPDQAQAFRWYQRGAMQKDRCAPKAQYELYVSYESGQGVRKDLKTATTWLKTAAEAGNPQAQATLGRNHERGYGVPRDLELAQKWRLESRKGVSPHDDHFFEEDGKEGPQAAHGHKH